MGLKTERYWHGGTPGLRVGDLVEPMLHIDSSHIAQGCPTCEDEDRTKILVTTDRDYARVYGGGYPKGALYRVEPLGELEDRFAYDNSPAWAVTSARVLAVYDPYVTLTPGQIRRAMNRWTEARTDAQSTG